MSIRNVNIQIIWQFNIDRSLIDTSQKLLFVFSKKFEKIFLKM